MFVAEFFMASGEYRQDLKFRTKFQYLIPIVFSSTAIYKNSRNELYDHNQFRK